MPNGRCYHHGGPSTGPRTEEGKRRISEASKREWQRWREERGAPEFRYVDSRRKGGRLTIAQFIALRDDVHQPEGER